MIIDTNKDNADFRPLEFAARVVKYDPENTGKMQYMNFVRIEGNRVTGTDGSRVHAGEVEGTYPDGFYIVVKRTKGNLVVARVFEPDGIEYPPVEDLFKQSGKPVENAKFHNFEFSKERVHGDVAYFLRSTPGMLFVNLDFLKDLDGHEWHTVEWTSDEAGDLGPIIFRNESVTAAIMPLRG